MVLVSPVPPDWYTQSHPSWINLADIYTQYPPSSVLPDLSIEMVLATINSQLSHGGWIYISEEYTFFWILTTGTGSNPLTVLLICYLQPSMTDLLHSIFLQSTKGRQHPPEAPVMCLWPMLVRLSSLGCQSVGHLKRVFNVSESQKWFWWVWPGFCRWQEATCQSSRQASNKFFKW